MKSRIRKAMSDFPRNRYDSSAFVERLDSAQLDREGEAPCITFPITSAENDEMSIYFTGCTGDPPPELMQLARETCQRIAELDNLVQDSCEHDFRESGFGVEPFLLYLAHIEIEADLVRLEYYGTIVNTQWSAEFRPGNGEQWTKLNF
jgi:hypothetical protein